MSVPHRDDEPDDAVERALDPDGAAPEGPPGEPADGPADPPAEDQGADASSDAARDAAWLAIVANYGDRPAWEDPPTRPHPDHPAGRGLRRDTRPVHDAVHEPADEPADERDDSDLARGPEERYVPPPPPPLPRTTPVRLLAWLGLLGVPAFVLLMLMLSVRLPSWTGTLFLVWFVGGFAYLVASMRREHHGGPDDGAVV